MSPRRIVAEARLRGLDLIAVTDHNSAENARAALRAAEGTPAVLPGLEVCSSEEVHVLALFDSLEAALALQEEVYRGITAANDPERFGLQVIANEHDEVLTGFDEHLLAGATAWSVESVVEAIHDVGGLAVAAHVDREGFGIIGQLGMIPAGPEARRARGLPAHVVRGEALVAARERPQGSRFSARRMRTSPTAWERP